VVKTDGSLYCVACGSTEQFFVACPHSKDKFEIDKNKTEEKKTIASKEFSTFISTLILLYFQFGGWFSSCLFHCFRFIMLFMLVWSDWRHLSGKCNEKMRLVSFLFSCCHHCCSSDGLEVISWKWLYMYFGRQRALFKAIQYSPKKSLCYTTICWNGIFLKRSWDRTLCTCEDVDRFLVRFDLLLEWSRSLARLHIP